LRLLINRQHDGVGGWVDVQAEQELTRLLAGSTDVVINRLPSLLGHLEPNGLSGLLLPNRRPVEGVSTGGNIFDLERDDVTTAQFAVDSQIQHGQVAALPFDLKRRPD
jgi:hypothetical protein